MSEGQTAEVFYREAIERLARSRIAVHLARTRLVYGEWLRGRDRRIDVRSQLGAAHEAVSHIGAEAFAERARRELLATRESVRKHTSAARAELTPRRR